MTNVCSLDGICFLFINLALFSTASRDGDRLSVEFPPLKHVSIYKHNYFIRLLSLFYCSWKIGLLELRLKYALASAMLTISDSVVYLFEFVMIVLIVWFLDDAYKKLGSPTKLSVSIELF